MESLISSFDNHDFKPWKEQRFFSSSLPGMKESFYLNKRNSFFNYFSWQDSHQKLKKDSKLVDGKKNYNQK